MAVLRDDLTQQHAQRALMTAMRVSDRCLALRVVAISIRRIFKRAATELALTNLLAWAKVGEELLNSINEVLAEPGDRGALRTALSTPVTETQFPEPYKLFVYRARTTFPVGRQPERLDLLLIALLCTSAGAEATLAEDVANGMRQAYKAIADDSRNHWRNVADKAPLSVEEVDALLETATVEVIKDFLRQVRVYLATPIAAPKPGQAAEHSGAAVDKPMVAEADGTEDKSPKGNGGKARDSSTVLNTGEQAKREAVAPTIAATLREAQLSPIGAKAGVSPRWDILATNDLAVTTRKLHDELVGTNLKRTVIAVAALVALLVSSNPKAARLLLTCSAPPAHDIEVWIDVPRGWICWRQQAYTQNAKIVQSPDSHSGDGRQFNIIPMPEALALRVRELHAAAGQPKQLQAALDHPFGAAGLLMSEVNARLKELGDQVHLAEPTRFASSFAQVVLEETGSDMAAGRNFRFEVCATSAPFYFSPSTEWLVGVYTRVYARLGLGRPVSMEGAPTRQGAGAEHEASSLHSGFERLVSDVVRLSETVQAWPSDQESMAALAQLAPRCAELFHISIGGRGSEPERITIASVMVGRSLFSLMDKKTEGEKSSRLLPHTELTNAAVKIFLAARHRTEQRLGVRTSKTSVWGQSLFSTIEVASAGEREEGQQYAWKAIDSGAISAIAKEYFHADLNFQRGLLVTGLGEAFVNRWLIRAMTGHGSYLTHAFAPSMGVAPSEALSLLRPELETSLRAAFGSAERLLEHADQFPEATTPSQPIGAPTAPTSTASSSPVSGDPLHALDTQCLTDWALVEDVRNCLAAADSSMAADVELLLSALAISGTPTIDLALDVVLNPPSLRRVGSVIGVLWKRTHYLHDLWLPLLRSTRLTWQHRGPSPALTKAALIELAAKAIRNRSGYHSWPADDFKTLIRFTQACEAWRRVELSPYLCAVALPWQESACLSHRSIHRLFNGGAVEAPDLKVLGARFNRGDKANNTVHGLNRIREALNSAATDTETKGRLIQRGHVLTAELDKLSNFGTPVFHFLVRAYRREAFEMVNDLKTANDASSAYTRFTALWPVFESQPWDADPENFGDTEWVQIVDAVNKYCLDAMVREDQKYSTGEGVERSSRARDALQRLFNILERDSYEIPDAAWHAMGGATVRQARVSASSTVILDGDVEGICRSTSSLLKDEPLLIQRIKTKVQTMAKAPLRLGEASCGPMDCVTQSGALAVPTTPFDVDKTSHAPRLIPLTEDLAQMNRSLGDVSRAIAPTGKWIYRFDDDAVHDDLRGNRLLAELIRLQTGEPFARPQSLRANAYQELLWPGWRPLLTRFLRGETTAQDCLNWLRAATLEKRWTSAISSAVLTGHGAVDPGLLNYAGAWHLIYAVHHEAAHCRIPPGRGWLRRLNLLPESMERARRRAGQDAFDPWRWLESGRFDCSAVPLLYEPHANNEAVHPAQEAVPTPSSERQLILHSSDAIRYLVLRALGLLPAGAVHFSGVAGRVQEVIESHCISKALVEQARKRAKQHKPAAEVIAKRVRAAAQKLEKSTAEKLRKYGLSDASSIAEVDILLEESQGTTQPIIQWILALSDNDAKTLDALFRRDRQLLDPVNCVRSRKIWKSVTSGIPSQIVLRLRFGVGSEYLTAAEEISLKRASDPWFLDSRHPDRGHLPDVSVCQTKGSTQVRDRRLTSLVRLIISARLALSRAEADYLKRTSGTSFVFLRNIRGAHA